ncbi:unnamed protein product [Pleuronectes platessa]|uniref:Uncharacterized protein n=1 Tax=Pleuronectes platessa TaxID=8262 RepID=A0A9N7Z4F7_PLEPL|nr:unnamed protein product [Pleuronectes platessa]
MCRRSRRVIHNHLAITSLQDSPGTNTFTVMYERGSDRNGILKLVFFCPVAPRSCHLRTFLINTLSSSTSEEPRAAADLWTGAASCLLTKHDLKLLRQAPAESAPEKHIFFLLHRDRPPDAISRVRQALLNSRARAGSGGWGARVTPRASGRIEPERWDRRVAPEQRSALPLHSGFQLESLLLPTWTLISCRKGLPGVWIAAGHHEQTPGRQGAVKEIVSLQRPDGIPRVSRLLQMTTLPPGRRLTDSHFTPA